MRQGCTRPAADIDFAGNPVNDEIADRKPSTVDFEGGPTLPFRATLTQAAVSQRTRRHQKGYSVH